MENVPCIEFTSIYIAFGHIKGRAESINSPRGQAEQQHHHQPLILGLAAFAFYYYRGILLAPQAPPPLRRGRK